jgi:hypothetical protein
MRSTVTQYPHSKSHRAIVLLKSIRLAGLSAAAHFFKVN